MRSILLLRYPAVVVVGCMHATGEVGVSRFEMHQIGITHTHKQFAEGVEPDTARRMADHRTPAEVAVGSNHPAQEEVL